jgi:thymidylate kinase
MKPKAIILDGVDGVGKSSVRILISNYNGNHFIVERFTPSIYSYGKFYNRKLDIDYIFSLEESLQKSFDVCAIFFKCSLDVLFERFKLGKHVITLTEADLQYLQNEMEKYIDTMSKIKWIKIDNTHLSPQEIFEFLKKECEL